MKNCNGQFTAKTSPPERSDRNLEHSAHYAVFSRVLCDVRVHLAHGYRRSHRSYFAWWGQSRSVKTDLPNGLYRAAIELLARAWLMSEKMRSKRDGEHLAKILS